MIEDTKHCEYAGMFCTCLHPKGGNIRCLRYEVDKFWRVSYDVPRKPPANCPLEDKK